MARRMVHNCIDFKGQRYMQTSDLRDLARWTSPGVAVNVTIHSQIINEPEPEDRQPLKILKWD